MDAFTWGSPARSFWPLVLKPWKVTPPFAKPSRLLTVAKELGVELSFSQYNGEGEIVEAIHALRGRSEGVLVNAGAYSHTSLAIRDALAGVKIPFVEVHLTNIYAREPERRRSALADAALAVICGFGAYGYELALRGLVKRLPVAANG